ncbi:MAG: OmpA family protein [Bacteroidetes bacterium]|nr:MAG: OmpA family protein [Bacteroidota bacterium]
MKVWVGVLGWIGLLQFVQAQPAVQSEPFRIILREVQFTAEKSTIRTSAARSLDKVVSLMAATPGVTIEIGAHTDASGSSSYNQRLSQKRAVAVRDYLIRKGVSSRRLSARGYGETRPHIRCSPCSDAQKQQNRRIELLVKGVPQDSSRLAAWYELGGLRVPKRVVDPPVPKVTPTIAPAYDQKLSEAFQAENPAGKTNKDYFAELSEGGSPKAPASLPATFLGYTIELACAAKPLAAGHTLFQKFQPVYLRNDPADTYCYFTGAFFTLPEAQQYLHEVVLPATAAAKVVSFQGGVKIYAAP